jgi:hypothetical protein
MVLLIEPLLVPSFEQDFQRKSKKETIRVGLDPHTAHHLAFGSTQLVLQEKVMIE